MNKDAESSQKNKQGDLNIKQKMSEINDAVNNILNKITIKENKMVSTEDICNAAEQITNSKFNLYSMSLKKELDRSFKDCGAITTKDNDNEFTIILNSDNDAKYRRFSLIHEIGHIVLNAPNFEIGKFVASFHINYKVNHLDEITDVITLNEEMANIFALCVLMPEKNFLNDILKKDIITVSKIYGVTPEAVKSRFDLILE
ncbi:MAG: hypothetical protein [Podoviridae sp. ctcf755]|nr:MAG: hypothetical protein [Podoviridae sp. ctcf755]